MYICICICIDVDVYVYVYVYVELKNYVCKMCLYMLETTARCAYSYVHAPLQETYQQTHTNIRACTYRHICTDRHAYIQKVSK